MTIALRPAKTADAKLLFDWLNAPDSLAAKETTNAPVPWTEHQRWLSERLDDPDTLIRIAERDGAPVGQVRLQRRGDVFDVDVYIVPAERRGGLASAALSAVTKELWTAVPGAPIRARVRVDNGPSQRLFESLGFTPSDRDDAFLTYICAGRPSSEIP